jgi:capsular polysaccharide biosynthesis protein
MGHEQQRQRLARIGEVPAQRAAPDEEQPATATEPSTGAGLTLRLALLTVTIILLGTAAGLAAALILPKTYGARAEILYPVQDQAPSDPLKQDRQLSTQLVLLKSPAVLGPVAQKQGREVRDLEKDLSVQVLENSEVIQVEAHGSTPQAAQQTLQSVIDSYLALASQPTGVARNLETQLAQAKANTAQLQAQVEQLRTAVLAGSATQSSLDAARAQLTASQDLEKALQARIDQVKLAGQQGPQAQLLTPPYPLPDPVFPQPLIAGGTGALVGVVVAGGMLALSLRRQASA